MKKLLFFLLAMAICISFAACDEGQSNGTTEPLSTDGPGANAGADTSWLIQGETVNVAALRESLEIVELTTDNWKEHFHAYHYSFSYDEEKVEKDAFGEIVSTETVTHSGEGYAFGAGNQRYHGYVDVIIELKDKTTGDLVVYTFGTTPDDQCDQYLEENLNLDNYECTRVKGSIYYFNIPMGEIPVACDFWPVFQDGMAQPGALKIDPGTYAFSAYFVKYWFS